MAAAYLDVVFVLSHELNVFSAHLSNESLESVLALPAENRVSLGGVTQEEFHLCRTEVLWVHFDTDDAFLILANLINSLTFPGDRVASLCEGEFHKFAHWVSLPRCQHIVVTLGLL